MKTIVLVGMEQKNGKHRLTISLNENGVPFDVGFDVLLTKEKLRDLQWQIGYILDLDEKKEKDSA